MNTMDNAKVIETMEKYTFQKYIKGLVEAEVHKITLFNTFPQNGVVNLAEPANLIMIDELSTLVALNSGEFQN